MDPYLMEWGGLLLRWAHVITGIAWIGSSFYFMHLDASLRAVPDIPAGKGGATWEVHGGGFYEVKKYLEAPKHLPEEMIWHKWQSYSTWITGFFLLVWVYYAQSELYLIDPAVRELSPLVASAIGLLSLAIGWAAYDGLCRSPLAKNEKGLALAVFVLIVGMAYGFQQIFSGRGAMIHIGAVMGTIMTANVFMIIIPGQKKVIAALMAGQSPDPTLGKRAKIRSTHNNYITLPVVFLMLSNHYPLTWSTPYGYVIVGLVLIAGAAVRHFYNVRHASGRDLWWTWVAAALCIWTAIWISLSASPQGRERLGLAPLVEPALAATLPQAPAPVVEIITSRCSMCHAREPVWASIAIAPKGVLLDSPEHIARQKSAIRMHSVMTHSMPPNNLTGMTLEERRTLALWVNQK
ncbi:MAG: urate hydroxylase PuuD [Rhizobiales bacterium]|nr:urate hydroxylase PuuD [Hyphomicrobiales bacterium]